MPFDSNNLRKRSPAPVAEMNPWDGVLLIDKPAGPTSHDVVDAIRACFRFPKVGHGGTLDPMATGLLVMLIGRGTKLSNYFLGSDKTYLGTMCLGVETDTQDAQGDVTARNDASAVTEEQVHAEMKKRRGDMMQTPPMVSAVKLNGVPLYKRARKGETVERSARLIHVYEFAMLDYAHPRVDFRVKCTKGTYVRTLCADMGTALGCGAHLERLDRVRCGNLVVKDALPLEDVARMSRDDVVKRILPIRSFTP